ncbi:hypothetical protein TWF481_004939 [Arthrobotrys musiformis]|uniref:F-box domain-containing protein n=1 Tax=Arthrobotrys musiformis TaxID=47236 RepID=A0AAV9WRQ5_9PEZI
MPTTIQSLPLELQSRILSFLPLLEQGRAIQVCKVWQDLLRTRQLQRTRYKILQGTIHPQSGQPLEVHQLFSSKVRCDLDCAFCEEEGREEGEDEDHHYIAQYDKSDGLEYQDDSFLSARISRATMEIKYYEFWVAIHPEPERSWSPAFDERFHKPRLSTSFPLLEDPVFFPAPDSSVEVPAGVEGEAGSVLEPTTSTNHKTDIAVPVRYRLQFHDCHSVLHPSESVLHISPTTTVGQLVSKTWGVLRDMCFARPPDCACEEIEKIEYLKFQFGAPSLRHEPAPCPRPPGFFVELYAGRNHQKGRVFSRAARQRHKLFAETQGKPRYKTRSVSQRQGSSRGTT